VNTQTLFDQEKSDQLVQAWSDRRRRWGMERRRRRSDATKNRRQAGEQYRQHALGFIERIEIQVAHVARAAAAVKQIAGLA